MNPNDLPTDNRPMAIGDLPSYEMNDEVVLELKDELAEDKDHLDFWVAVVEAAKTNPKMRVKGTQILRTLTTKDLEEKLAEAQKAYDRNRELYRQVLLGEVSADDFTSWSADYYARAEGLPRISDLNQEDED